MIKALELALSIVFSLSYIFGLRERLVREWLTSSGVKAHSVMIVTACAGEVSVRVCAREGLSVDL